MKQKFFLGMVVLLLAGTFSSCKIFKRDKCGDCPKFSLIQSDNNEAAATCDDDVNAVVTSL
ncbi:MAG: hypothetical protein R2798_09825 [Chitinophagales bacterium]|nr:hypothetical protein [Bacteroidota bacterium]